jgi:dihydrofolate reductase
VTNIIVFNSVTLDGVMQGPGRSDEDRRGGFKHGGWSVPYADAETGKLAAEGMQTTGAMLLGRRTYEDLLSHWNKVGGPFKDMLNSMPKYVVSRTLKEPLPWPNSTLLEGELTKAVAALRKKDGKDIVILGSGKVVRKLLARQLVDQLILLIHPLVLGDGQRLFDDGGPGALRARGHADHDDGRHRRDIHEDGPRPEVNGARKADRILRAKPED